PSPRVRCWRAITTPTPRCARASQASPTAPRGSWHTRRAAAPYSAGMAPPVHHRLSRTWLVASRRRPAGGACNAVGQRVEGDAVAPGHGRAAAGEELG